MSMAGNKSLFECCVCYSFYNRDFRKPKYLMCHHTVCLDCICKTLESSDSSFLQVRCPLCRVLTTIQSKDINQALRTNQDILDFMDIWIYKLSNNVDSRLSDHCQVVINQNCEETSSGLKWCRDCQDLAFDACHDNKHCTVTVSPTILKFAEEALAQGRQSLSNWEKAISKRDDLRAIVTSIQSSVNRLKERVDGLVDENDRALVTLRDSFEDIKQSVATLDPLTADVDFKGFVIQSEHDLKNAAETLETFSSFDGALVSVLLQSNNQRECGMLSGIIRWDDTPSNEIEIRVNETADDVTNSTFLLDARRFIGFLLASVPYTSLPNHRRSKDGSKKNRKIYLSQQSAPCLTTRESIDSQSPLQLPPATPITDVSISQQSSPSLTRVLIGSQSPTQLRPATPIKDISEFSYPPINECTSTCAWNPTENILASTRKNESVCLNFGPKLSDVTPLLFEGNNQTSGGQDHRLAWNSKGTQLATGSRDGWISFWTSSGTNLYRQKQHHGEILALKWSHEGKFLATGGRDTLVKVWNAVGQNCVQNFTYHKSAVWDFDWQSENTFASCDMSGKMFFGDIRLVDRPQFAYTGHQGWVKCLQWDNERFLLASCSSDKTVKIWTPFVPPFLQEYTGHKGPVNAVQWSPAGSNRYLASCSDDQTAQILDVKRQAIVHQLESKTKPSKMTCLSFSSDGKLLATGNENGAVEIWNVHNGRIVSTFKNFEASINKIAWQKGGTILGVARHDKTCAMIDIKNNKVK
ncbi:hypothetical protein DAPPUDRAFT_308939 [Daphnia pulex]|uniref:RING-type domain-containing protein n=1 Tax=Daphnia pulex TaxID=6669 RepID=E9HAB6_DAPPU|nr:hypothetical protein DAPPUDRAFT_308939 [Daphnia pulex]|eukprot:EFX71321.1 hypothetical protein DAPPUDRAFT_308939 [Daphnia pulex]